MKIQVKNLGVLQQAEFTLGDMTILCGGNNTGKTYATYALFGFLSQWQSFLPVEIPQQTVDSLLSDGVVRIDVREYAKDAESILMRGCRAYEKRLPEIFAASENRFRDSQFSITIQPDDIRTDEGYDRRFNVMEHGKGMFLIKKEESSYDLVITLLVDEDIKIPDGMIVGAISFVLEDIVFSPLFPRPFIVSAERTGTALFYKNMNFARRRMRSGMFAYSGILALSAASLEPALSEFDKPYAAPIEADLDLAWQLEFKARKNSFVANDHPDILADFADIIGGEYAVTDRGDAHFIPKDKGARLTIGESSSSVRSLFNIGFYLRHIARHGDLLMVDEPELSLHPENQRRVARLFARLVNIGIKVFITTHSDYIIKELNTLIMLKRDRPHLKAIAEREGYKPEELIDPARIRVYIAEEKLLELEGGEGKVRGQTLTQADIDPELGIEARSFDTTIDTMNRIQKDIIWGEE